MQTETILHRKYLDQGKDFNSYITSIMLEGEKVFPKENERKDVRTPAEDPRAAASKIGSGYGGKMKSEIPSGIDSRALNEVGRYFTKIEERSKSPISGGFRKINGILALI